MNEQSHRAPLGRGWSLWKWIAIRGAGFAVDDVLQLADRGLAAAADELLVREAEELAARDLARTACDAARNVAPHDERDAWSKVLRALARGRLATLPSDDSAKAVVARLSTAVERTELARQAALDAFAAAMERTGELLRGVAEQKPFHEALLWQNRKALRIVRHELERAGPMHRTQLLFLASYLQRYCTKNDTIGFFGPIGWGEIESVANRFVVEPGPTLLDRRQVFFEYWCIEALGAALAADPELRPWARPRRRSTIRLEGDMLFHSLDRTDRLPPAFARALASCDGTRTAHAIAEQLASQPELELEGIDDALGVLEELVEKNLIDWSFEVPNRAEQLGALFERELSTVPGAGGERALAAFNAIEAARSSVVAAAGDPERLDAALGAFDDVFTLQTGRAGSRNAGQTYGARTLLYEDCRRDCELKLAPDLLRDALGTSLPLVLTSARWYTWDVARRYNARATELFHALRSETGGQTVDYVRFFAKFSDHFSTDPRRPSAPVREALEELQRRWMNVLEFDPTRRRVLLRGEAIAERVEREFAAPGPGWPLAIYHSPDLMIAANNVDEIRHGECDFVIGEVHTGELTLFNPLHRIHHPTPDALVAARAGDVTAPTVAHLIPKDRTMRTDGDSTLPRDFHVINTRGLSWLPTDHVLGASELVVEELQGVLRIHTRDNRHSFDVADFFAFLLDSNSSAQFRLLPKLPHLPRITVDRLVLVRESWSFDPAQLAFATAKQGSERFLGARRWACATGLPRFVFTKVAEEPKPSYLDFDSPISVDLFAKQVAAASELQVSEMLPTPEQAWLPDRQGKRYVCELRMAAVDPLTWNV